MGHDARQLDARCVDAGRGRCRSGRAAQDRAIPRVRAPLSISISTEKVSPFLAARGDRLGDGEIVGHHPQIDAAGGAAR